MRTRREAVSIALTAFAIAGTYAKALAQPQQGGGAGPDAARIDRFKAQLVAGVESRHKLAQVINDTVFSFGELGYQEVETSNYLTGVLEKAGFRVDRGVAGMPTAWVARWGSGKPVIALGSDLDCIPNSSQKPGVAYRDELVEGAPGHGEGHNSGQAVNIVAALALKDLMERERLPGTLVVWPGIAEELLAGKSYLVRAGVFRDVDAVLFTHVGNDFSTAWGHPSGSSGMISVEYTFKGESAHAAAAPWRGRNALRAVQLMNIGWDFRREHLRPVQRSHYTISYGGDQPNVVPPLAKVWYFIREMDFENIKRNYQIANTIAQAAAAMTETTVTHQVIGAAAPRHFNRTLAETLQANIDRVGLPKWSPEDQAFAKAVQKAVGGREEGLANEPRKLWPPVANPDSGPSDDIGEVSWVVPTATLRYPANIPNLPGHHWSNAMAMATPIAHKGIIAGSKVMAMTVLDLILRPELIAQASDYFHNVQLKNNRYEPLLPDSAQPQIHMNREMMARYRPQMSKFYYDASRYDTYLEQLGVKYPQLVKP